MASGVTRVADMVVPDWTPVKPKPPENDPPANAIKNDAGNYVLNDSGGYVTSD